MREVIRIDKQEENDKPVEFTHMLKTEEGWSECLRQPINFEKVVYLGCCELDGDMFACYNDYIDIYKGHLNSGKY